MGREVFEPRTASREEKRQALDPKQACLETT